MASKRMRMNWFLWRLIMFLSCTSILVASCAGNLVPTTVECEGTECDWVSAEREAGFTVARPEYIPEHFDLLKVTYDEDTASVIAMYDRSDGSREVLILAQRQLGSTPFYDLTDEYPAGAIRQLPVEGTTAQFVQGAIVDGELHPSMANQQFVWQMDGMEYSISAHLPTNQAEELLVRIAESMN